MIKRIMILAVCIILLSSVVTTTAISRRSILQKNESTISILSDSNKKLESSYNFDGETKYVDDNNIAGPWNGTQEFPYQKIQNAIDNASQNDTIYVFNGTYNESIVLDKTLRLIGENKNNTIINAGEIITVNATIDIDAENVEIYGFTIKNTLNGGSGFSTGEDNCTIHDNIITQVGTGLLLGFCDYCYVYENIIIDNNGSGILLIECRDTYISRNLIENNNIGIWTIGDIIGSKNKNNNFVLNRIKNNSICGIASFTGKENNYFLNDIENNGYFGVSIQNSKESIMIFNKIENNGNNPGELIEEDGLPGGIFIKNSDNLAIKFNNIQNNAEFGLNSTNSTISCTWNYWGSIFGPSRTSLRLLGDLLIDKNSVIEIFPWLPFKNPLAGYNKYWIIDI